MMQSFKINLIITFGIICCFIVVIGCTEVINQSKETEIGVTEIWIETGGHCAPFHKYVEPGAVVTWINKDTVAHIISSGNPSNSGRFFLSDTLQPGNKFKKEFNKSETYPYHCAIHGLHSDQMPVLIVTGPNQPDP